MNFRRRWMTIAAPGTQAPNYSLHMIGVAALTIEAQRLIGGPGGRAWPISRVSGGSRNAAVDVRSGELRSPGTIAIDRVPSGPPGAGIPGLPIVAKFLRPELDAPHPPYEGESRIGVRSHQACGRGRDGLRGGAGTSNHFGGWEP